MRYALCWIDGCRGPVARRHSGHRGDGDSRLPGLRHGWKLSRTG